MAALTSRRPRSDSDGDEVDASTVFGTQESFARFLIIESTSRDGPITSLSPFVVEKRMEALIGAVKSVRGLRGQALLVETARRSRTGDLLRTKTFFDLPVQVSEHKTLSSSRGIVGDRALKGESDDGIGEDLQERGVAAAKGFKVGGGRDFVDTSTILLTFNSVVPPRTLKVFYRIVPVEMCVPGPLRCFSCQRFGHHEGSCPVDIGSVCERCGGGGGDHHTGQCTGPARCVNCGRDRLSGSSECEVWKGEKEIMKLKVTKNLTYPEARKLYDRRQPEFTFAEVVRSLSVGPETKAASTQCGVEDSRIAEGSTVVVAKRQKPGSQSTSSSTASARPRAGSRSGASLSSEQPSAQERTSGPSASTGPASDGHISDGQSKGSNDAVGLHNGFGAFDETGDMEFEETPTRPRAPSSRSISPVHPP